MTGADQAQWVSVRDACQLLNRSERTIRRMAKDGRLRGRMAGGQLLVDVSELVKEPQAAPQAGQATPQAQVAILQAQVEMLTSERDYLRGALAQALTQTKAIEPPKRRFRWPWQRED